MSRLTVARALTARIGQKAITFFTSVSIFIGSVLLLATWALAYFFSPWWWLLLIPIMFLLFVYVVIRLLADIIVKRIHAEQMNALQRKAIDDFVDKIHSLLEARATPPWLFVFITIKDLLLHRDVVTIKKIISDSSGLRRDYLALEKLF